MQCEHIRYNGKQCKKASISGARVCEQHGGQLPATKIQAEHTLALLRLPAIEYLFTIMDTSELLIDKMMEGLANRGYHDTEMIRRVVEVCHTLTNTVTKVLDRTGLGPTAKLEVSASSDRMELSLWTVEEKGELAAIVAQHRDLKERVKSRLHQAAFKLPAPPEPQVIDVPFKINP